MRDEDNRIGYPRITYSQYNTIQYPKKTWCASEYPSIAKQVFCTFQISAMFNHRCGQDIHGIIAGKSQEWTSKPLCNIRDALRKFWVITGRSRVLPPPKLCPIKSDKVKDCQMSMPRSHEEDIEMKREALGGICELN